MYVRNLSICLFIISCNAPLLAQQESPYEAPRTPHGQPDLEGVWATHFATMMERPDGVESLAVTESEAHTIAADLLAVIPHNEDPQFEYDGVNQLALVAGEYRTSIIVNPEHGKLPYKDSALQQVGYTATRYLTEFDHPEQRGLMERCLQSFGFPPIQVIPIINPYQIVQTRDQLFLYTEGPVGIRIIHLNSQRNQQAPASHEGYSTGYWEGDTLVVETSNFREDHPIRSGFGTPMLITPNTEIEERFTRLSDTELNYFFTVTDDELYTQPWSGEFSLYANEGPIYEYACHEGNYSLPSILRGGQMQAEEQADRLN
ncbi:MAG: hypothetical protein COB20_08090 [SAR86 cluster bacterium]|uniref:Uncharacterized protein n=1 Tax=SAR86 cluster bacterium TaxID=2030880 RepID=A0A2A4X498_9GAMM|nr:MAG: hypothetical protein COB20_08090 [SAR86 cluster bacterium]